MVEDGGWIELAEGEEFAGYRIERRLGRGGMGILYLAVEPGLDRRVALKLIAPEAAADEIFARRFAEESRIAASIEHPNVVPIYAAGEEGGVPYIAMRYVAGSDLGRRIAREGRIPPPAAVELIAQVGNGLDAIHAAGLVHRDVKPANVLLGGEEGAEHAYITDFGVARNVATQSGLTQTGRFVGTLDYVAPEQISGREIDARVDVYALGCLLHKLLTGEVPFPREGEAARLYAHLHDPPPAPSLHEPSVPMALDDVVARAMSKSPADRYPSAGDLGRAAGAALSGTAVTVPERTVATGAAATREAETVTPTEALTEPRVEGPRRRPLLIGGGLAAIAGAAAIAFVLASGGGGDGGTAADGTNAGTRTEATTQKAATEKPESKPQRLSTSALVKQADESCETAKTAYLQATEEFPQAETEAGMSVEYAERLVDISGQQVTEMEKLVPPQSKEDEFREYLESREEVAEWDEDALRAAKADNPAAYMEAYDRRNLTEGDRQRIADEIGFEVCSQPQS
jgi:hypothetical protein